MLRSRCSFEAAGAARLYGCTEGVEKSCEGERGDFAAPRSPVRRYRSRPHSALAPDDPPDTFLFVFVVRFPLSVRLPATSTFFRLLLPIRHVPSPWELPQRPSCAKISTLWKGISPEMTSTVTTVGQRNLGSGSLTTANAPL